MICRLNSKILCGYSSVKTTMINAAKFKTRPQRLIKNNKKACGKVM
jgi:hypothetical protein